MGKKGKKKRVLRKESVVLAALFLVAFIIVVVSLIKLIGIKHEYSVTDKIYKDAKDAFVVIQKDEPEDNDQVDDDTDLSAVWYEKIAVDFSSLQEINPEIVGWIYFEDEDISYPILFSGDNAKYLRTSYDRQNLKAGSIFVDGSNNTNFQDNHTIVYGHNMKNLSMFGKLRYYRQDNTYADTHRYFQIHTQDAIYRYMIISYREVEPDDVIYTVYKGNNEGFSDFVTRTIKPNAQYLEDWAINDESRIVTLSTCSKGDRRFVVSAVLIDEH